MRGAARGRPITTSRSVGSSVHASPPLFGDWASLPAQTCPEGPDQAHSRPCYSPALSHQHPIRPSYNCDMLEGGRHFEASAGARHPSLLYLGCGEWPTSLATQRGGDAARPANPSIRLTSGRTHRAFLALLMPILARRRARCVAERRNTWRSGTAATPAEPHRCTGSRRCRRPIDSAPDRPPRGQTRIATGAAGPTLALCSCASSPTVAGRTIKPRRLLSFSLPVRIESLLVDDSSHAIFSDSAAPFNLLALHREVSVSHLLFTAPHS